ncbi:MAG: hypothetical protein AB7K67_03585 [Hyphomicrobiaceae bacterium]
MQARVYDTIVIGIGGMGSAALCALARRARLTATGLRVFDARQRRTRRFRDKTSR